MARRVYLHIGLMKSGTTYLQELCELNRDVLADSGVLWPTSSGGIRYRAVRELLGRTAKRPDDSASWHLLARQVRQHLGDVVLSNELLAALGVRNIKRLTNAFSESELHVVITARDLARVMPSHWQTTIKMGKTHTWSEFASSVCADLSSAERGELEVESADEDPPEAERIHDWFWRRHDVVSIIAKWQTCVPADRMTLVTVPPSGSEPETVARRFGSVIGVDLTALPQPASASNLSLGAHSAELLRRLNEQTPDADRAERKYVLGGTVLGARTDLEPRFALSQAQQDWVRERAQRMIDGLEHSGVRVEGELADLIPASQPPAGAVDPSDTSDTELLQVASHALIGMVAVAAELRTERDALRLQAAPLQAQSSKLHCE